MTLLYDNNKIKVYDSNNNLKSSGSSLTFSTTTSDKTFHVSPETNIGAQEFFISLEGPASSDGGKPKDKIRGFGCNIELITPAGDPVNSAVQSGEGQNEFVYSYASPGVLTINLKAKVTPSALASQIKKQCHFTVGSIGSSTLTWNASNPGGVPTVNGEYLEATVTFTGLPSGNNNFGTKKAAIYYNDEKKDEEDYEVFFPYNAYNNPDGNTPNWYYYWSQIYENANVSYDANFSGGGNTPGMTDWKYSEQPDKNNIFIGKALPCAGRVYDEGDYYSGIDMFVAVIIHEEKHVSQIQRADALLPTSGQDSFRYGWSWNKAPHNHWQKGSDNKWGVANLDDDGNSIVDDAKTNPPFEPGNGDDISLEHSSYSDWPNSWTLPIPNYTSLNPIESEAINASDTAMDEDDYSEFDWGLPGKQHKTLNYWLN